MFRRLVVDAGTTGVRGILFLGDGAHLASDYRDMGMRYRRSGWVQQDLSDMWERTGEVSATAVGVDEREQATIEWCRQGCVGPRSSDDESEGADNAWSRRVPFVCDAER